jgi:hypothetical protein
METLCEFIINNENTNNEIIKKIASNNELIDVNKCYQEIYRYFSSDIKKTFINTTQYYESTEIMISFEYKKLLCEIYEIFPERDGDIEMLCVSIKPI